MQGEKKQTKKQKIQCKTSSEKWTTEVVWDPDSKGELLSVLRNLYWGKKFQFLCWQKWLQSHVNPSTNKKRSGLLLFIFLFDMLQFFFRAGWKAVSACSGMVLSRTYLTRTGGCHYTLPPQSLMWGMCLAPQEEPTAGIIVVTGTLVTCVFV